MALPSLFERRSTTNLLLVVLVVVVSANGLHDGPGGLDSAVLTVGMLGGLLSVVVATFLAVVDDADGGGVTGESAE